MIRRRRVVPANDHSTHSHHNGFGTGERRGADSRAAQPAPTAGTVELCRRHDSHYRQGRSGLARPIPDRGSPGTATERVRARPGVRDRRIGSRRGPGRAAGGSGLSAQGHHRAGRARLRLPADDALAHQGQRGIDRQALHAGRRLLPDLHRSAIPVLLALPVPRRRREPRGRGRAQAGIHVERARTETGNAIARHRWRLGRGDPVLRRSRRQRHVAHAGGGLGGLHPAADRRRRPARPGDRAGHPRSPTSRAL